MRFRGADAEEKVGRAVVAFAGGDGHGVACMGTAAAESREDFFVSHRAKFLHGQRIHDCC
jgi:hypothetical protein